MAAERRDSVPAALANAWRLLKTNPPLAEEQAVEIIAVASLEAEAHLILGLSHAALGRHEAAVTALRQAVTLDPKASAAWRALGDQLTILDDGVGADAAYAQSIKASVRDPQLLEAAVALNEGKLAVAERALRTRLKAHPTDVPAIRMLAEVGARLGRYDDAETLLRRCLALAPSFTAARHNYALVLHRQSKAQEALAQLDALLAEEADNPGYRFLKAAVLTRVGDYEAAIAIYEDALKVYPNNARVWLSLGHARKTLGRQQESIAAYMQSIVAAPQFGEAYWSLANMKTYRFEDEAVRAMEAQLKREDLIPEDRFHFHYALGKAFEDRGAYAQSFGHYCEGARLRRTGVAYDANETSEMTRRHVAFFTAERLARHAGQGAPASDPIFIVGLPRAGSTLIEQILSSHTLVEGTMELPDITMLARRIGAGKTRGGVYPEALSDMSGDDLRALGEEYLARTRIQRKTDRPFFIDKMPNNFLHVGLIRLILPNAKIIDARRHPLGCCFSAFKQHFARGQNFSYDLTELGRYYADYVSLMEHIDAVAPESVHRVFYERMIADPEAEIRRLLDYCGLDFEPACLAFHTNTRAVRTASSEQVRQAIYSDAVDHWRAYEPFLAPLTTALGPALARYPQFESV